MKPSMGLLAVAAAVGAVVLFTVGGAAVAGKEGTDPVAAAAKGELKAAKLVTTKNGRTVTRTLPFLSAGAVQAAADALAAGDERLEGADATPDIADSDFSDIGGTNATFGCAKRNSNGNTRVNQDCSFRRQAEEIITYNPADPKKLVAGQNDSRVGYNQCGIDYSVSDGNQWGDLLPPFRQRTNHPELMGPVAGGNPNNNTIGGGPGTAHTYDAGSDPASAVDSQGRAYFSCVVFDIASNASGLYVTQSPQGADGSFYFNIPDAPSKRFMVVEDNNGLVFHDKNFIAADRYAGSPNHDNVYVTWTVFFFTAAGNYQRSPIYGSMSTDHAVTWSTPQEISGISDTLCFFGNLFDPAQNPHACDFNQGSDPVVMPDGSLVVTFNNGNTAANNPNGQQLAVVCHPTGASSAGTGNLNCAAPSKVGDDFIVGEPLCNFGRGPEECIPGAYIRTNDFPRITQDNTQNGHLQVVWQDYRNGEFDIQLSVSTDGGLTWHEAGTVNPDTGLDHYFAATDQSPDKGDRVGVSYYRTERVPNENTTPERGFAPGDPGVQDSDSDYVVAGGTAGSTPYDFKVVSPVFPPPNGSQIGFNGDYSGLTVNRGEEAHPIWSDTRNEDPFAPANGVLNDEDVFTDKVALPNGKAKRRAGKIGRP